MHIDGASDRTATASDRIATSEIYLVACTLRGFKTKPNTDFPRQHFQDYVSRHNFQDAFPMARQMPQDTFSCFALSCHVLSCPCLVLSCSPLRALPRAPCLVLPCLVLENVYWETWPGKSVFANAIVGAPCSDHIAQRSDRCFVENRSCRW